jgi:hypothetical protein
MLQLFLSSFCLPGLVQPTQGQHTPQAAVQSHRVNIAPPHTSSLTHLAMSVPSLSSPKSSDSLSQGLHDSSGTTATSMGSPSDMVSCDGDGTDYEKNEMNNHELQDKPSDVLSYISSHASKEKGPRYSTTPCIGDIFGRCWVNTIRPESILYDKPPSTLPGPHDQIFDWRLGVTLYKNSLSPGKIGGQTTHLGIHTSQKDQSAGLFAIDESTYLLALGFAARVNRVHEDWVNSINTAGNNTKVDMDVLEEAKTLLTELYQPLGGEHTVHDFGNLVSTFEAKAQQYISELRFKKGLSPDFRETRRVAYQWFEPDAPRDPTEGEEGGGQACEYCV